MTSDDVAETLIKQNELIINLLGRMAFPVERVIEIVTRAKKDPEAYKRAYNALDGRKTGTDVARVAGVTQQAMSSVLQTWEQQGIVFNIGSDSQPRFRKLFSIPQTINKPEKRVHAEEPSPE